MPNYHRILLKYSTSCLHLSKYTDTCKTRQPNKSKKGQKYVSLFNSGAKIHAHNLPSTVMKVRMPTTTCIAHTLLKANK